MSDDVAQNDTFADSANSAKPEQVPPEAIDQLFDMADHDAALEQLARSLDAQRRQLLLMWIAVLGLAGVTTFIAIRGLRDA